MWNNAQGLFLSYRLPCRVWKTSRFNCQSSDRFFVLLITHSLRGGAGYGWHFWNDWVNRFDLTLQVLIFRILIMFTNWKYERDFYRYDIRTNIWLISELMFTIQQSQHYQKPRFFQNRYLKLYIYLLKLQHWPNQPEHTRKSIRPEPRYSATYESKQGRFAVHVSAKSLTSKIIMYYSTQV